VAGGDETQCFCDVVVFLDDGWAQSLPVKMRCRPQDRIHNLIGKLADVLRKEWENPIAVLLKQGILAALSTLATAFFSPSCSLPATRRLLPLFDKPIFFINIVERLP
jgi:hypothetical protein